MENYKSGFNKIKSEYEVFEYYDFEREIVNLINDNRFSIILKGRQVFVSTILATYTAWQVLNGKQIAYYSHNRHMSKHFLTKVRAILMSYGAEFECDNQIYIKLKGLGSIKGLCTPTEFCSHTFDEIIYDEAAYINRFNEALSIGTSIIATGGKIILASTPNGLEKFFYTWQGSEVGDNPFKRIKVTYKDVPIYDEAWAEEMKRIMNYNKRWIDQELHAEFIPALKNNKNKLIQFRIDKDLNLKLLEKLIEKDVNISTYMRDLILKDVNN